MCGKERSVRVYELRNGGGGVSRAKGSSKSVFVQRDDALLTSTREEIRDAELYSAELMRYCDLNQLGGTTGKEGKRRVGSATAKGSGKIAREGVDLKRFFHYIDFTRRGKWGGIRPTGKPQIRRGSELNKRSLNAGDIEGVVGRYEDKGKRSQNEPHLAIHAEQN